MAEMTCNCPHCGQKISVDSSYAGHTVQCPQCSGDFTLPAAPAAAQISPAPQLAAAAAPTPAADPQQYGPSAQAYAQFGVGQQAAVYQSGGRFGIGALFSDPLDAQPQVMASLGPAKTGRLGWLFFALWTVGSWLFSWRMGTMLFASLPGVGGVSGGRRGGAEVKLIEHIEWIISGAVPLAVLVLVLVLLATMAGKQVRFGSVLLTSGMVALPMLAMGTFIMLISTLKIESSGAAKVLGHITIILSMIALTSLVLLIKASLVSVIGYTRKAAFWLVPGVLLAVGYLSNWIGELVGEISK